MTVASGPVSQSRWSKNTAIQTKYELGLRNDPFDNQQRFALSRALPIMHEHPEFFVSWGTLSLINAGLAQSKGRSGFLWWLGSLFIGPIATLLIVVLPKPPQAH